MQKRWLKNFEFHINPVTWNTAQDLVQAGGVKHLREVEKHFWVAIVEDGEFRYEIETMITPHKIKAFTCECWQEGRRLMCPHIAAALLRIRQFLAQKAEERQQQQENHLKEAPGRLTVQHILDDARPEEVLEFVRAYARRDRDFGLALKTWFAGSISNAENPFALVLDAALPRNAGSRPLREPELRRLRTTLDDLEQQLKTAKAQGNARTVYLLGSALLRKIAPILPKTAEERRDALAQYCHTALEELIQFPAEQLSPELRAERFQFLLEFLAQGHHPPELERNLIRFLSQAALYPSYFEQINALFDHTPFPAPAAILHLFLAALAERRMPEAVARVLEDYVERPAQIKEAIVSLHYLHQWPAVIATAERILAKGIFNAGQRRETEDLLFLAAEKTGDLPRQRQYLRQRYCQTGHTELVQRLKTLAGTAWPEERTLLMAALQSGSDISRLAPLLAAEGDLSALQALLEKSDDFATLQEYEHYFWPERTTFVRDRYIELLTAYLGDHFGRQASAFVRDQLARLLRKGQAALVLDIVQALTEGFADRHTLPEELAELFPKIKRAAALASPEISPQHES